MLEAGGAMTLRAKLLAAQAPLVLVLVVFGYATAKMLTMLGNSPELILKDNYRSVLAAERMLDALERLQDVALARATGRPADDRAAARLAEGFEGELSAQEHNITEAGEDSVTRHLRERWTRYRGAFDQVARPAPAAGLSRYFEVLDPAAERVREAAREILALNQDAMGRKSDGARRLAERNVTIVVGTTIAVLVLGLVSSLALTQEFNTMADGLAEYRRSSLGELLQAQQASQAAIDSLPDPVLVLDAAGGVLNLNGAAESMLHMGAGGPGVSVAALEPELRAVVERVREHVASGRGAYVPHGFEEAVRVSSPEGDRHLLPRATPLYSEQGIVVGTTIVLQDVTRLMRFDELKNDLVATVAHEFRTPLTSLRMAIHLCAQELVGPLTEKQGDLMAAAREDCERLQSIVDDLLDLSRIQAGRMSLAVEPLDAGGLLEAAAGSLRSAADAAGVSLAVSPPATPLAVQADPERAQLVLTNLIANAVRHTPAGGRVEVQTSVAGELVRFEVRDTGEGIAREHRDRIFEKFYRVPGARSGGVGLGLYIARAIVHAHGGELGVESEAGRGSTFWFTLRLAPAQAAGATATA